MTDQVSIANRALADAGTRSTIVSFTEGSNESNNVSLIYVPVRQQLQRAAHWGFAGATATLSLLKSAPGTLETPIFPTSGVWSSAYPPPPWMFEYAFPSDCLQGRKLIANFTSGITGGVPIFPSPLAGQGSSFVNAPGQKFSVATDFDSNGNQIKVILANIDQAILSYTRDITIESLWDAQFEEAMVAALAAKLAWALTGDKARANDLMKIANDKIIIARAGDGNESLTVMDHVPDWIRAHGMAYDRGFGDGWSYPFGPMFLGF